jgi:hypothetical protein
LLWTLCVSGERVWKEQYLIGTLSIHPSHLLRMHHCEHPIWLEVPAVIIDLRFEVVLCHVCPYSVY